MSVLSILTPLNFEDSFTSDFVNVSAYRQIRVSVESDSLLDVFFEWSIDASESQIVDVWNCHANTWKTGLVDVVMPNLRLRIEKKIPSSNNRISVYVNPVSLNKALVQPQPQVENDEKQEKRKSKSPFLRRFSKKEESPKAQAIDYRLPTFIPAGALLIGGRTGQIEFLPRGLPGEILVMGERGPLWIDPSILNA